MFFWCIPTPKAPQTELWKLPNKACWCFCSSELHLQQPLTVQFGSNCQVRLFLSARGAYRDARMLNQGTARVILALATPTALQIKAADCRFVLTCDISSFFPSVCARGGGFAPCRFDVCSSGRELLPFLTFFVSPPSENLPTRTRLPSTNNTRTHADERESNRSPES